MAEEKIHHTAVRYEDEHVHKVYEAIAPHFSATRYKPWPIVEQFLQSLPSGSVGFDAGCGNGKYLSVNPSLLILASDRSSGLVTIASHHRHLPSGILIADGLTLPHPDARFDFALSIAVVHHLSTRGRRVDAVKELLRPLKRSSELKDQGSGKCLIFVWALEQKNSKRGWSEENPQDVMVPWVLQEPNKKIARYKETKHPREAESPKSPTVFQRYYHLYRKGELEEDVRAAGGNVLTSGYEKDNWWAIAMPVA